MLQPEVSLECNGMLAKQSGFMPPRWPRQPDRHDPAYRRLADRMNFAVHTAIFAAVNSGLWFFKLLQQDAWPWTLWMTGVWATLLLTHAVYVFGVADYSDSGQA